MILPKANRGVHFLFFFLSELSLGFIFNAWEIYVLQLVYSTLNHTVSNFLYLARLLMHLAFIPFGLCRPGDGRTRGRVVGDLELERVPSQPVN